MDVSVRLGDVLPRFISITLFKTQKGTLTKLQTHAISLSYGRKKTKRARTYISCFCSFRGLGDRWGSFSGEGGRCFLTDGITVKPDGYKDEQHIKALFSISFCFHPVCFILCSFFAL